jgi:uncharacterized membrane protein YagU involved in acid resistance
MFLATIFAGLIVSVLIGAGTTLNFIASGGENPIRLLQFVASGFYGDHAFAKESQTFMAWIGLLFHTFVSWSWAFLYFILYDKITSLVKNWWLSGISFGLLIWLIMAFVIMPLSQAPRVPVELPGAVIDIFIIVVGAGLPIALLSNRYFKS